MDQYLSTLYELDPSRDPIGDTLTTYGQLLKDLYALRIIKGLRGTVEHYEFSRV